jgi:chorismate mutase/prephenate dehydratase
MENFNFIELFIKSPDEFLLQSKTKINQLDREIALLLEERIFWHHGANLSLRKCEKSIPAFDLYFPQDNTLLSYCLDTIWKIQRKNIDPAIVNIVSFLGPRATYSEEAAITYFGERFFRLPCRTFDEVIEAVNQQVAQFAIIPFVNSTEGCVNNVFDMLLSVNVNISGHTIIPIRHNLLSTAPDISKIEFVHSHPQALAQCSEWLKRHGLDGQVTPVVSTASAVIEAKRNPRIAAIASKCASDIYEVPILYKNIENRRENRTRFLVLGGKAPATSGNDLTLLYAELENRPGSLFEFLEPCARRNISVAHFETRPSETIWSYRFYFEIFGHKDDPNLNAAIQEMIKLSSKLTVFGSYPAQEIVSPPARSSGLLMNCRD